MGIMDPAKAAPIPPGADQDAILRAVGDEITNRTPGVQYTSPNRDKLSQKVQAPLMLQLQSALITVFRIRKVGSRINACECFLTGLMKYLHKTLFSAPIKNFFTNLHV